MQVSPRPELDQQYNSLTPQQKAIVDAVVENPDATNRAIAHEHGPRKLNEQDNDKEKDQFNESYVSQFCNDDEYAELITYKQELQDNQRQEGSMQTTGDPFSADPNMPEQQSTWQGIKERPVQQTQPEQSQAPPKPRHEFQAPVRVEQNENSWTVEFEPEYFQHLLSSKRLPPELHEELVEAVITEKMA